MNTRSYQAERPVVWCISGSDSGGGAGLQADLLTVHDLGSHGCSVLTAVTAQNSEGVYAVESLSPAIIAEQGRALCEDLLPQTIKIGLVANDAQVAAIETIISQVRRLKPKCVVIWDPVQISSTGVVMGSLSHPAMMVLLAITDVVTPNRAEADILTKVCFSAQSGSIHHIISAMYGGKGAVVISGGNNSKAEEAVDELITPDESWQFVSPRQQVAHTHGTGCTFSSAIAAVMSQGFQLHDAVCVAKAYVNTGLAHGYPAGQGAGPLGRTGWPDVAGYFPRAEKNLTSLSVEPNEGGFAPLNCRQIGLYPVIDSLDWLERLIPLKPAVVQLRIKQNGPDLAAQIQRAIALAKRFNISLFINDYWEMALKYGAYGVHLGQDDLTTADLTAIARAGLRLGVSTHGYAEIQRVCHLQPSYIALGHIFPTQTKQMPSKPQGLNNLACYTVLLGDVPTVAIGGINTERFLSVAQTGVNGIAVVTAITEAQQPEATVALLQELHPYVE